MDSEARIHLAGAQLLEARPAPRLLSLVIPMYNEGPVIPHLRRALTQFVEELPGAVEIVLVNDGSRDLTLPLIAEWAAADRRVKVVNLSRNFGHQNASTAGLDYSSGDAVVLLDADLQDPLSVIHEMILRYREGYDVVYGQRRRRSGEGIFKVFSAWIFYRVMRNFVYRDLPVDTGDFRLISRNCLAGLEQLRETHRFLRGMVAWVGYAQIGVEYERAPRVAGQTKYPLRKMLRFAWIAATSFSALPLRTSLWLGLGAAALGFEETIRAILAHVFGWYTVSGWASLTVLVSFLSGATLISIGIVGEYVGKIYEQSKDRPIYLASRTLNIDIDTPKRKRAARPESLVEAAAASDRPFS